MVFMGWQETHEVQQGKMQSGEEQPHAPLYAGATWL